MHQVRCLLGECFLDSLITIDNNWMCRSKVVCSSENDRNIVLPVTSETPAIDRKYDISCDRLSLSNVGDHQFLCPRDDTCQMVRFVVG